MDKKIKVLLADNSEFFGIPCANGMRGHGLDVALMAKDGKQVVAAVEKEQPDVLLMDFFLPGLDAIGVLGALNALPQKPLVMVMSSYDNPTLELEVLMAGASYYFLKPFDIDEMAERILSLCQKNRVDPLRAGQPSPSEGLEVRVTEIIHQIGVPAHIKGYQFLRDAILMAIEDGDIINAVTKRLYPAVAKKHATTSSRVERAIRHAIEVAWDRGDVDILNAYFGYTIQNDRGKPTNSEFIAMISDKFRLQLKIS
ncbi:MAG: sporulation transcription factor Spo0A [Oscillospiraceae bacterium]|nr:sporulation transcription factor Spo0A [Oscillospiraceae bacterium]